MAGSWEAGGPALGRAGSLGAGSTAQLRWAAAAPFPLALVAPLPAAMARVAGSLQKSGEVMALVNGLIKVPELQKTMAAMSRGECGGRAGMRAWRGGRWAADDLCPLRRTTETPTSAPAVPSPSCA